MWQPIILGVIIVIAAFFAPEDRHPYLFVALGFMVMGYGCKYLFSELTKIT